VRFSRLLKIIEADLVHTHVTTRVGLQASAILQYAKIPWVWTIHGLYRSRGEDTSDWAYAARLVMSKKMVVTGVSRPALNELTSYEDIRPEQQRVIYNGINLEHFNKRVGDRDGFRKYLGIPSTALVFGTAGRLVQVKRQDLFLKAADYLLQEGVDAYFLIAGDGPLYNKLKIMISDLKVESRVHLLGYQDDMPFFLSALDVFVLPSDSESFGLALVEACAVGLPCIATAVGGVPDVLENVSGLLIDPGSIEELAEAMRQMTNIETRKNFAQKAKSVVEKYSHIKIASQYANLYSDLLEKT
jgi:glycosyltransferase involved in cell wall biosynthesis